MEDSLVRFISCVAAMGFLFGFLVGFMVAVRKSPTHYPAERYKRIFSTQTTLTRAEIVAAKEDPELFLRQKRSRLQGQLNRIVERYTITLLEKSDNLHLMRMEIPLWVDPNESSPDPEAAIQKLTKQAMGEMYSPKIPS